MGGRFARRYTKAGRDRALDTDAALRRLLVSCSFRESAAGTRCLDDPPLHQ